VGAPRRTALLTALLSDRRAIVDEIGCEDRRKGGFGISRQDEAVTSQD
jgi:hypothetical protein